MAELSFINKGTKLARRQLNLIDLFNITDTLKQRGLNVTKEGNLKETLLNSKVNPIFNDSDNGGKESVLEFLNLFSEKRFREKIRGLVFGQEKNDNLFPDATFKSSEKNQQRFSKTVELLLAYQCIQNLSAFSASFGVKIENAPKGGDFDCLANFQTSLFHFEIKSGDMKNISREEIQHFLLRHDFLCPEASVLFLDYKRISNDFIRKFLGLRITELRKIGRIMKVTEQGKRLFMLDPGVIVVDVANNGNILQNIQFAMKFLDRYKKYNNNSMVNLVEPEHLGVVGEWIQ
jgi:hypothetical protein